MSENHTAVLLRNDEKPADAIAMWAHGTSLEDALACLRDQFFAMLDTATGDEDPELVADWDRMVAENENGDEPAGDFSVRLLGTFR